MITDEDIERIIDFFKSNSCAWVWVDIVTNMGPTKLENFFREKISEDTLNHWSPTTPEGYLEIGVENERGIVVHWMIGEEDKVVNVSCADDVDFDEIDKSLAATIIHNSVIRIMSEKF